MKNRLRELIDKANKKALERIIGADPVLVDMAPICDVIPGMHRYKILHAGPPIAWNDMTETMKGSVVGAVLFEGLAKTVGEALELASSGGIEFACNNDHGGVCGMTGVLSMSMPVYVIQDRTYGCRAYCQNEERLMMGGCDDQTIRALHWLSKTLRPALSAALRQCGGVALDQIRARAIHMGDEIHNRSDATALLLFKELVPAIVRAVRDTATADEVIDYLAARVHQNFGTRFNMGASKVALMAAENIEHSTIVTVIARNGVEVGIKLSGLVERWFTGPANRVNGIYFAGFADADACMDLGDSAITETAGWGAFVSAAAPSMVQLLGGSMHDGLNFTQEMYAITVGENPKFTIPYLDFRGAPVGIDIRKVVETGVLPIICTAIAHKDFGVGVKIGAGFVRPPIKAFEEALKTFAAKYVSDTAETESIGQETTELPN